MVLAGMVCNMDWKVKGCTMAMLLGGRRLTGGTLDVNRIKRRSSDL